MRIFSIIAFSIMFAVGAESKSYDRLLLKDGSEIDGHIVSQKIGKSIVFQAEKSLICISMGRVSNVTDQYIDLNKLSEEWQMWAKDNPSYVKEDRGSKSLLMNSIRLNKSTARDSVVHAMPLDALIIERVRVVEKGATLKYLDLTPAEYTFSLSDIHAVQKFIREDGVVTGLNDVIETTDGLSYEGQITEQVIGKSTRILTGEGVSYVIDNSKIKVQSKKVNNPNQDIFQQAPFIDIVITGTDKKEGIIVYQNYGTKKEIPYLYILDKERRENRIDIKNIKEMSRIENPQYVQIKEIHINPGELYINQHLSKPVTCEQDGKSKTLYIEADSVKEHIVLSLDSIHNTLLVEMENLPSNNMTILLPIDFKKIGKTMQYAFNYEDLLTKRIVPHRTTIINNDKNLQMEYEIYKGIFVLYHPETRRTDFLECK